jgi:hypothetical protein
MSEFHKSLKIGEYIEYMILEIIKEKYPLAYKVEGYFKDYDIYVPEKKLKIEVKLDRKSLYTGNFVVEIEMYNKPSALFVTKSDFWIFYDGLELMYIKPIEIKDIIIWNELKAVRFIGNGDTESKRAILVPKHLIRAKSKIQEWILPQTI